MVSSTDGASRSPFVHEAVLVLADGVDPAAPGAAVTVELCGHWEHEGGCRWPHNSETRLEGDAATFRVVFVAPPAEEQEVRERIELALRSAGDWSVTSCGSRLLQPQERALADRLGDTPVPTV